MKIKKFILAIIVVLLAVPLVSADAASTSVSVLNIEPVPLRYWVDGLGPVEYNHDIEEFMSMYPKKCDLCEPYPYWDSSNPNDYVIVIEHPNLKCKDVLVRFELDDVNGYDDVTEVMVSELVNIKKKKNSIIPPFPLYLESGSVTSATYSNTFRLDKEISHGPWRIQFSISDSDGIHYTNYGYFFLSGEENAGITETTSWWETLVRLFRNL
ncbi:MAG: hypothetical protein GQ469_01900 [Methanosarcinales archaeon]|nr:hypothetical protein [Methanosarcinales archaeon]